MNTPLGAATAAPRFWHYFGSAVRLCCTTSVQWHVLLVCRCVTFGNQFEPVLQPSFAIRARFKATLRKLGVSLQLFGCVLRHFEAIGEHLGRHFALMLWYLSVLEAKTSLRGRFPEFDSPHFGGFWRPIEWFFEG